MKVKNIMFSGVMGVILMSVASSANAAISVASKAYVDTKASSVEAAYKAADTALETAYKEADTALGARVTQNETDITKNAQAIAEVKDLTGTEGVAEQITAAKTELTTVINKKVDTETYTAKVGELEAADEALAGDIAANAEAIEALDTTYVSENEMNTFKASNTEAIADAKKAGTDAAAALAEYETANDAKVLEIETALGTKIAMPAACETQDCVLAINKASGTISWTPLTEPVADFINQQN